MATDRQKVCKCGINVADLLNDIHILNENMIRVDVGQLPTHIESFKLSINSIYGGIRKVEESCGIDASAQWHTSLETDNKIDQLKNVQDRLGLSNKKVDILGDLSQIRYQITEKVRKCSKSTTPA